MKSIIRESIDTGQILLGILSVGLGLKGFLLSSQFIDGGVTGISMLIAAAGGLSLPVLLIIINLPFIVLGYNQMGLKFAIKSALAIGGLAVCLAVVKYPDVTPDKLLTAVFGGIFIGAGIGLAIRGGAVLDGTEIAALLISKSSPMLKVGDVILVLNIFIFAAAAFLLSIESALYSILTYFAASKMVDFIVYGIEEFHGISIVSSENHAIKNRILHDLSRGVTVYQGRGGMTETETDILFCVVTRLEVAKVKSIAKELDPTAFIVIHHLADATGGVVKKRLLH